MKLTRTTLIPLLTLALTGCGGYMPPPVEVVGDSADLRSLAGSWRGTFRNAQLRRGGQIEFRMSATADSAFGEVNMYTSRPSEPIWTRPPNQTQGRSTPPSWLRIRFVRVEGGYVNGEMEPMYEPRCQCTVVAKFIGRRRGSVIEGSFTSRSADGRFESSGSWRADRVADAAQ